VAGYDVARRVGLTWLAAEFTAAVLAAGVVVALLPAILILLTRPVYPWLALATVLPLSVPLAGILTVWALRIPPDLIRQSTVRLPRAQRP
jgi:hypothetical protein